MGGSGKALLWNQKKRIFALHHRRAHAQVIARNSSSKDICQHFSSFFPFNTSMGKQVYATLQIYARVIVFKWHNIRLDSLSLLLLPAIKGIFESLVSCSHRMLQIWTTGDFSRFPGQEERVQLLK